MLVQKTQANPASPDHLTFVSRIFSTNKTKDRAFAGAVTAHKSDMFTGIDL
jgi:hypothetical protein